MEQGSTNLTKKRRIEHEKIAKVSAIPTLLSQGAEAKVYLDSTYLKGRVCVVKERFTKSYRHPDLDQRLTRSRLKQEASTMERCKEAGVRVPELYNVEKESNKIYMEYVTNATTLKEYLIECRVGYPETDLGYFAGLMNIYGRMVGTLHQNNIIHGDLTTSNILKIDGLDELVLIDFGLSFMCKANNLEDKAVDLYVLERAFLSIHPNTESLFTGFTEAYRNSHTRAAEVLKRLEQVRARGRKRSMVG